MPTATSSKNTKADHQQNQDFERRRVEDHRIRGYDFGSSRRSILLQLPSSQLSPTSDGTTKDEDKQGLARTLFTELVYDLDTQRLVSFKLKPWADEFLTVRAAFFGKEDDDNMTPTSGGNSQGNDVVEKPLGGVFQNVKRFSYKFL